MSKFEIFDFWAKKLQLDQIGPVSLHPQVFPTNETIIKSFTSVPNAWKYCHRLSEGMRHSVHILTIKGCESIPIGQFSSMNIFYYYGANSVESALKWFHATEGIFAEIPGTSQALIERITWEATHLLKVIQQAPFNTSDSLLKKFFYSQWIEAVKEVLVPGVSISTPGSRYSFSNCLWVVACRELSLMHNNTLHPGFNTQFM